MPSSAVRGLRDIRAALRHGDAVVIRRLHGSVINAVAAALAAKKSVPPVPKKSSRAWDRVGQYASITRDAVRVTAVLGGFALAVLVMGEELTIAAIATLAMLPAVVILAKTAETGAVLSALREDALRVETLRHAATVRRQWLTTVERAYRLLARSLTQPHALYETPTFSDRARVLRRPIVSADHFMHIDAALEKARKVETIVRNAKERDEVGKRQLSIKNLAIKGWSDNTYFWRRMLAMGAAATTIVTVLFAIGASVVGAVAGGLATSAFLAIRYAVTANEVNKFERLIRRDLMRLRYPDLLKEVDAVIQDELDYLIRIYSSGLDVEVDPFEDLEPQLRTQVEDAIVAAEKTEKEMESVVDLRPTREPNKPGLN